MNTRLLDAPARTEFRRRLDAARDEASSLETTFSQDWAAGTLSRRQMGFWAMQHWYYIERIPQQFGIMYARCPDVDARQIILENLIGEETPGARHPDLLLDFALACGYSGDEVARADREGRILPAVRAMRAWIEELVQSRHLAEQAAGIMVALEGQLPAMYGKYVETCKAMGFTDRELSFFTVHIEGDTEHADVGYRVAERYAATEELEQMAVGACRASAQMRRTYLEAVTRAIREMA